MSRGRLAILASVAVIVIACSHAAAQQPGTQTGLSVSPAIQNLTLTAEQDSASFSASVTNNSNQPMTIETQADDFTTLNNGGGIQFLNNTAKNATPHGLAHWMSAGMDIFSLQPGSSQLVPVTITGASTMAPGGHYGALIFEVLPSSSGSGQKNRIGANTEVSVLVFVTTANPGREAITLLKPSLSAANIGIPSQIDLVFQNIGDIQTTPRGLVIITDNTNQEVARGIINTDSGLVLPGTVRLYQVEMSISSQHFWPGLYHINVFYRANGQVYGQTYSTTFFYVSQPMVVALGAIPLVGFIVLVRRINTIVIHYRLK